MPVPTLAVPVSMRTLAGGERFVEPWDSYRETLWRLSEQWSAAIGSLNDHSGPHADDGAFGARFLRLGPQFGGISTILASLNLWDTRSDLRVAYRLRGSWTEGAQSIGSHGIVYNGECSYAGLWFGEDFRNGDPNRLRGQIGSISYQDAGSAVDYVRDEVQDWEVRWYAAGTVAVARTPGAAPLASANGSLWGPATFAIYQPWRWPLSAGTDFVTDVGPMRFWGVPFSGFYDCVGNVSKALFSASACYYGGVENTSVGGLAARPAGADPFVGANADANTAVPECDWEVQLPRAAPDAFTAYQRLYVLLPASIGAWAPGNQIRVYVRDAAGNLLSDAAVPGNSGGIVPSLSETDATYSNGHQTAYYVPLSIPTGTETYLDVQGHSTAGTLGTTARVVGAWFSFTELTEPGATTTSTTASPTTTTTAAPTTTTTTTAPPSPDASVLIGTARFTPDPAGALHVVTSQGVVGLGVTAPTESTPARLVTSLGTMGISGLTP